MNICQRNPIVAVVLLAGSLVAVPARADGLYAGASLGTPRYRDSVNGISGSGSGLSGKLFGGYQLMPSFALEAGYADLGHIYAGPDSVDGHGLYLDAVGIAPLSPQWALLGRIGLAHVDMDTSRGDASGTGLKLGFGAQYSLTGNIALRGEWERYRPDVFNDRPNIDQFTVGLRFAF